MDKEKAEGRLQLHRKASPELYLGHDPASNANTIPFRNLHNKVYFKTIE